MNEAKFLRSKMEAIAAMLVKYSDETTADVPGSVAGSFHRGQLTGAAAAQDSAARMIREALRDASRVARVREGFRLQP